MALRCQPCVSPAGDRRRPHQRCVTSVLTALGLSPEEERRYQQLLPLSGGPLADVATVLGTTPTGCPSSWPRCSTAAGRLDRGGRLTVLPLPALVAHLIEEQAESAARSRERLHDLAQAIPFLVASATRPGPGQMEDLGELDGELSAGGNALQLLTDLIESSKGDLLWWRPGRLAAAARVGDLGRGRPGRRVRPAVAGDLPPAGAARGARGAAGPGAAGRAGARHRRDADPDAGDPGHPRDPPRAARVRRRAAAAGPPVGDRRAR